MPPRDRTRTKDPAPNRAARALVVAALACGCAEASSESSVDAQSVTVTVGEPELDAQVERPAALDASVTLDRPAPRPASDAGPDGGARVVALRSWTPVRKEPRRDAEVAGYLRTGAVVDVESGPFGQEGCALTRGGEGGWFRVRGGGYVCVGGTNAAAFPARDFRTPAQPDLDASMPYRYAVSYGRANMYRRLPSAADIRAYEPWRARALADAAATDDAAPAVVAVDAAVAPRDVTRPRLDELEGDPTSPVIRRMLNGMYVALDRSVRDADAGARYWLTQSGGLVRDDRLSELRDAPTFRGVELDATRALPVAWMVSEFGWSYAVSADGRGVSRGQRSPRHTSFMLADAPPLVVGARTFYRTLDGGAVLAANVRRAALRPPPEGAGPDERWIDVDLDEQVLVAYEGARPVYATLVSSGRRTSRSAPERFETPEGEFRIQSKHITTTMDGDTATDGPYSIEDVPWVMYFQGSYALHAAFWHGYFGWRMSHGCVNLSPPDARRMFLWADPALPAGWHGVSADAVRQGSRVVVRHSRQNVNVEAGRPAGAASAVPHAQ